VSAIDARGANSALRVSTWRLWKVPGPALKIILAVEIVALVWLVLAVVRADVTERVLGRTALLCLLAVVFAVTSHSVDRFRRFLGSDRSWVDATSVWAFAAVLSLPAGFAALVVLPGLLHLLLRTRRQESAHPHRIVFTAATMVLATLVASSVVQSIHGWLTVLPGGAAYLIAVASGILFLHTVNQGLVAAVIYLVSDAARFRDVLISRDDLTFELVSLVLGVMTGELVIQSPWLSPGSLAVVALLYRSTLIKQLQKLADTDAKTGLLNSSAWQGLARRELARMARGRQSAALLLIDLDHFKLVNDTFGHLMGDRVLIEVAACLQRELREYDAIGRFGGEEFVVLLENASLDAAADVAVRLRAGIGEMVVAQGVRVTASVGLAHTAHGDATLDDLLQAADSALYEAKALGRDRVRLAPPVCA
jgi:diguanylate cyclase (GGDEF)-like protein